MSVKVMTSKHQPGVTGADNCFEQGDRAVYTALKCKTQYIVEIDSELMSHKDAPLDGLVYECILDEQLAKKFELSRCCLSAHQLTPNL